MSLRRPKAEPRADADRAAHALVDRLLAEMSAAWSSSSRLRTEDLLRTHAWLHGHPEAALRVVVEEVILADAEGAAITNEAILCRFPQWREQLEVMLEAQRLLGVESMPPQYPQVGDVLEDFCILAKLGSGGQGRVFLARQISLADRPLVLKVTPCIGQEHLSLARLQHTYIAPLFWAQDFPKRNLRVLCMPFLGAVTLDALQKRLQAIPAASRSGRDVRRVLDEANAASPITLSPQSPDYERLATLTCVQAVVWLGACVADALHYAHRRGLVHLDLKPSNVLLAADGQPVVLDFHLARQPIEPGELRPLGLGGTPGYTSPEQDAAVEAFECHQPTPARVDGQSDQYSLAVVLCELLGCERTKEGTLQPHRLRRENPQVSVGLSDILVRCLQNNPAHRYSDAAALAGDLRRHLDDLPLTGVANRSPGERWAKWRRRRPHALPLIAGVLLCLSAAVVGATIVTGRFVERTRLAEEDLRQGKEQIKTHEFREAALTLERARDQAAGLPGAGELTASIEQHLLGARRGSQAKKLQELADEMRFKTGLDPMPPRMEMFVDVSQLFWADRESLRRRAEFPLPAVIEDAIQADLRDIALLSADLSARLPPRANVDAGDAHRHALQMLTDAKGLFGPSAALSRHRWVHALALGDKALARQLEQDALDRPPTTAWEHFALGRFWLLQGDLDAAHPELELAAELDPNGFAPHFYLGVCTLRRGEFQHAVTEFTFCAGQKPVAWCYFYRARAHRGAGHLEPALKDFGHALNFFHGTPGAPPAEVHYQIALVHIDRKDAAAARASIAAALECDREHAGAVQLKKQLATP